MSGHQTSLLVCVVIPFAIMGLCILLVAWKRDEVILLLGTPELRLCDGAAERRRVFGGAYTSAMKSWTTWFLVLAASVGMFLAGGLGVALMSVVIKGASFERTRGILLMLIIMVVFISVLLIPIALPLFRARRFVRDYLIEHGIPVCLKCGYDLRGLDSGQCPECGTPFEVKEHIEKEPEVSKVD